MKWVALLNSIIVFLLHAVPLNKNFFCNLKGIFILLRCKSYSSAKYDELNKLWIFNNIFYFHLLAVLVVKTAVNKRQN